VVTTIQRWGNSQGLRLSREVLQDAGLSVGQQVKVAVRKGRVVVAPAGSKRRKHDLAKLVAKIPKGYRPREVRWGAPVGREVW
jgi:antitoxin MazE